MGAVLIGLGLLLAFLCGVAFAAAATSLVALLRSQSPAGARPATARSNGAQTPRQD